MVYHYSYSWRGKFYEENLRFLRYFFFVGFVNEMNVIVTLYILLLSILQTNGILLL